MGCTAPDINELHDAYASEVVRKNCGWIGISEYDLPQWFRDDRSLSPYLCPRCHGTARWRRGQEFWHMMRCGKCGIVWTPGSVVVMKEMLSEELALMFGDGI